MAENVSSLSDKPLIDLVIGANSAIGRALVQQLCGQGHTVYTVSRPRAANSVSGDSVSGGSISGDSVTSTSQVSGGNGPVIPGVVAAESARHWDCDYSAGAIARVAEDLKAANVDVARIVICNGVLHGENFGPERTLKKLDPAAMKTVFETNAMLPLEWLSALYDVIKRASAPAIAVLSARVGSIGDNRMGGWYSYRGSKAALNMMLQCAAIEFHRNNKRSRILAFHPGTTDTPLSKPFQRNVPAEKLFTPAFVAERLLSVLDAVADDPNLGGSLAYRDWAGKDIPW